MEWKHENEQKKGLNCLFEWKKRKNEGEKERKQGRNRWMYEVKGDEKGNGRRSRLKNWNMSSDNNIKKIWKRNIIKNIKVLR